MKSGEMLRQMEQALSDAEHWSVIGKKTPGVAHDVNNLVTIIHGNLELALSEKDHERANELIKIALRSIEIIVSRIRHLQYSLDRLNQAEHKALDLNKLIEEALKQAEYFHIDKVVTFDKLLGEIKMIDGEGEEILSALLNLIKNAIEAMPNGGNIKFETGMVDEGVFVRITDNGIGMSEKTRRQIFRPGFSLKGGQGSGRGLGMSNVHDTMRDHGGKIAVVWTEQDKGTTIEMIFPAGIAKAEELKKKEKEQRLYEGRILVVDDDNNLLKLNKRLLEREGYYVDTVNSGQKALEHLEIAPYHLLISDIEMPDMNGWELAMIVKGRYGKMKVILSTGFDDGISKECLSEAGVDCILTKPFDRIILGRLIKQTL